MVAVKLVIAFLAGVIVGVILAFPVNACASAREERATAVVFARALGRSVAPDLLYSGNNVDMRVRCRVACRYNFTIADDIGRVWYWERGRVIRAHRVRVTNAIDMASGRGLYRDTPLLP